MRRKRLMLVGVILAWAGMIASCSGYAPDFGVGAQLADDPDGGASDGGEAAAEAGE